MKLQGFSGWMCGLPFYGPVLAVGTLAAALISGAAGVGVAVLVERVAS